MAKPKIFVSHSTKDNAFTSKLVDDLNAAGADAWMDVNNLGAGSFPEGISKALADCEWFVLVLTRNALTSRWVRMEVDAAIRLKHQGTIHELIFIKASDVDYSELPALWGVINVLDATMSYEAAVEKALKAIGLPLAENDLSTTPENNRNVPVEVKPASQSGAEWILQEEVYVIRLLSEASADLGRGSCDDAQERYEYATKSALYALERLMRDGPDDVSVRSRWVTYLATALNGQSRTLTALGRIEEAKEVTVMAENVAKW